MSASTLSVLPLAFYFCAQLDAEVLVHGTRLQDGTLSKLNPDDLVRCINAKSILLYTLTQELPVLRISYGVNSKCPREKKCFSPEFHLEPATSRWEARYHLLSPTKKRFRGSSSLFGAPVCSQCINNWNSLERKTRRSFWQSLPKWLNIQVPGWPDNVD